MNMVNSFREPFRPVKIIQCLVVYRLRS